MSGISVVCNTVVGGPGVTGQQNPTIMIDDKIIGFPRDDSFWIVGPNSSKEGRPIQIVKVDPAKDSKSVRSGTLTRLEKFYSLVAEDHQQTPGLKVYGMVLLHGFDSIKDITPGATSVLASRTSNTGEKAFVIRVRDNTIFQTTVKIPGDDTDYTFKFECRNGEIHPYKHKQPVQRSADDNDYGEPGGSVLAPVTPPQPPKSLFEQARFP